MDLLILMGFDVALGISSGKLKILFCTVANSLNFEAKIEKYFFSNTFQNFRLMRLE